MTINGQVKWRDGDRQALTLTRGLEVECDQLGSAEPHGQRVVVGGVEPLSTRVDPGQLQAVVLQEPLALDLVDVLLCLGLGEGGHVPETGPLRADLCNSDLLALSKMLLLFRETLHNVEL